MAVEDVLAKLNFSDNSNGDSPTQTEIDAIKSIISQIYSSAAGKQVLDVLLTAEHANQFLTFTPNTGGGNVAYPGDYQIFYDFSQPETLLYLDHDGAWHQPSMTRIISHEMAHAILGVDDLTVTNGVTPGADYIGDAVRYENTVMTQLGDDWQNVSYLSAVDQEILDSLAPLDDPTSITFGTTFSSGNIIVDNKKWDLIDTSDRTDAVTIVGADGDDKIRSGSGDDLLYGGDGSDVFIGNAGWDVLFGNAGADVFIGGSSDTFTSFDLTVSHPEWDDGIGNWFVGGAGDDVMYAYHDSFAIGHGEYAGNFSKRNGTNYIDGTDNDFTAYVQFMAGDELRTAEITADQVAGGLQMPHTKLALSTYSFLDDGGFRVDGTVFGQTLDPGIYVIWTEYALIEQIRTTYLINIDTSTLS